MHILMYNVLKKNITMIHCIINTEYIIFKFVFVLISTMMKKTLHMLNLNYKKFNGL